jgi:polyether ionophore transport system ATP-binding protein
VGVTPALSAQGLRKTFGNTVALDGLDLTVEPGEIHGFLGPNGSGKTTTIRILLGLLRADAGTATLLGGDPWHDAAVLHRQLAYVPGDVALWPNLTGGEVIDLLARLRGGIDESRRDVLLKRFDLDPTKKTRAYSKGNRQKVALVAALASDVPLLLLDEPTSGLDPLMEELFRECVREIQDERRTILLSSHILSEVEALCDRLTIIREGRTLQSGSLAELRHLTRSAVSADVTNPTGLAESMQALPGVHDVRVEGSHVRCSIDPTALDPVLGLLREHGVRSLTSAPPSLEELFMDIYRTQGPEPVGTPR